MFYRAVLKSEVIGKRDIVDDDVEQAVIALSCDAKALDKVMDREMAVRIISDPAFVEVAHNIGYGHRGIECQR